MLSLRVPAKINLDLRVAPPRADGFHPLSSWFVTVGLFDTLTIDTYPLPGIHFSCDDPELAVDGRNLVVRAASDLMLVLSEDDPARKVGLSIGLQKRIPTGGGLGGGSADAAYTLMGVCKTLDIACDHRQLHQLAARLGSDVPFFLDGPSSLCTGRGEVIDPLPPPAAKGAVLILPPIRMPTPAVYKEFDRLGAGSKLLDRSEARAFWTARAKHSAIELLSELANDLEAAAFTLAPELDRLRRRLEGCWHRPVRMSGSGSTLFSLFDTLAEAQNAAEAGLAETTEGGERGSASEGGPPPPPQYLAVEVCPDTRIS